MKFSGSQRTHPSLDHYSSKSLFPAESVTKNRSFQTSTGLSFFNTELRGWLMCFCQKGLKLIWGNSLMNILTSGHLVPGTFAWLIPVQTYLCHSVLWAGWWRFHRRPQWPFPCGLFSAATWEREETKRRPHMEVTQLFLPSYLVHTSVAHIREGSEPSWSADVQVSQMDIHLEPSESESILPYVEMRKGHTMIPVHI